MAMGEILIQRARLADVDEMKVILDHYAKEGELLNRSRMDMYERIRDMIVARVGGEIIGMAAFHVLWQDLGEVRSLAVSPDRRSAGVGGKLLEACMEDAKELGIRKVFSLTYRPEFFEGHGFTQVDKSELPHKVWKDCLNCVTFPDCDEVALIREVV
jgi:amino-acid N-acetyltransferase